jgi:hypothetical protein
MWCRGVFTFLGVLLIAGLAAAVDPTDKCEADKLKEAGKYHFCRMKAESKAVKKSEAPDYGKCVDKFTQKWPLIESKAGGACPTNGDQAEIETEIADHVDYMAVLLSGGTSPGCPLPATGQTTAYPADKNDGFPAQVAVPDDGTLRAGAALSYVDNGDGTITDLNTGLMWEKKSNDGGLHSQFNRYRWSGDGSQETIWDWLDDINAEDGTGFAGYADWRIPNLRELQTIIHYEQSLPAVDPVFDTDCAGGCTVTTCSCTISQSHWSSTSALPSASTNAWKVDFGHADVFWSSKPNEFYVRAVRGP